MRYKNILSGFTFLLIPFVVAILVLSSCKEKKEVQAPPPEIPVVKVSQKDIPVYIYYVGQIYGLRDITINARVEGFLQSIDFKEGERVHKGQLLYTIDPEPFIAKVNEQKSRLAKAKTMLVKAKADLDRIKPLAASNAVSQSDLDAAQAQYDAAKSAVEAAKANVKSAEINLSYTRIKSPIDGIIGITRAKVGEFVGRSPNPVILNMVSNTKDVIVKFFLPENEYLILAREYQKTQKSDSANLQGDKVENLELLLADGSTYKFKGRLDAMNAQVDPNTGSILIQAIFPNPNGLLKPGMYTKVKVKIRSKKNALVIPRRCLIELQGQYSVFVVNDSSKVVSRQVDLGYKTSDMCIIDSGLKEGELVVIDALQKVRPGMVVKPKVTEFESKFKEQ